MKPPVAILFTLSYGAGLVTGLLHFLALPGVAVMAIGALVLWRRPLPGLLLAVSALGGVSGMLARVRESGSCPARLPAGSVHLQVQVLEPADSVGGRIAVKPVRISCHGSVIARWPRGRTAAAGLTFTVDGNWTPRVAAVGRPSGMLVVTGVGRASGTSNPAARLRTSLANASGTLYGSRAPMVEALILGRRDGIDRELQNRFAQSGLVHLLSISGFHVGVITAWIFLLGRLLGIGRIRALLLAAAVSVAYVVFLGWPAPAARAAALAVLVALSRARQRRIETNALLSATCLGVLLLDSWALLDLGAWLSASALWGATTFSRWTDRTLGTSIWWRTLGSSVGATLTTAPITASALGAVAVIGIALNFVAIPLAGVAVPGVLASLVVFPVWPGLAAALAGGAGLALHLLELVATGGAAVPGGHLIQPAELRSALPWLAALIVSLWAIGARNTFAEAVRRWSWAGVATLWAGTLWVWAPGSSDAGSGLTLHFLDVGQGDAAVLRTPSGRWIVIDAGPRNDRSDAGRRVMVPFLASQGAGRLAVAFVSHAHADHLGGMPTVLDRFRADIVIEPGDL